MVRRIAIPVGLAGARGVGDGDRGNEDRVWEAWAVRGLSSASGVGGRVRRNLPTKVIQTNVEEHRWLSRAEIRARLRAARGQCADRRAQRERQAVVRRAPDASLPASRAEGLFDTAVHGRHTNHTFLISALIIL